MSRLLSIFRVVLIDWLCSPPSTYQEQPTIWVAEDEHGLSRHEVAKIEAAQVKASMHGAHIDKDGTFSVSRGPPVCVPSQS